MVVLVCMTLLLGTTSVALAKPQKGPAKKATTVTAKTSPQTLPAKSTYEFAYKVPDNIVTQQNAAVGVTFKTAALGQQGYTGVRFEFAATNTVSGTTYFTAKDSANNSFTFTNNGTWGPQGGFALPAQYTATTNWTMKFTKAGQYNIVFKALDTTNNVITEKAQIVTVTDAAFIYSVPAAIYATQESTIKVALRTNQSYNNVHLEFAKTAGPGTVTYKIKDASNTTTYYFTNTGSWNIANITGPYNVSTPWAMSFSLPGTYSIIFKLVDNNSRILAQGSKTIVVKYVSLIDDDDDDDEDGDEEEKKDRDKDKKYGKTHGLLNALRNHYKKLDRINNSISVLIQKLLDRGVSQAEIDAIK